MPDAMRDESRYPTRLLAPAVAALVLIAGSSDRAQALTAEEIESGSELVTTHLRTVTERLAADDLEGRDNDTPASARTQRYLIGQLRRIGPGLDDRQAGDDAYRQPFVAGGVRGTNLLAVVPGRELADEYVIVGAHYDHLGTRCDTSPGGRYCNGAIDNATGVAAAIAIGNALLRLPEPPRRSIVLALWDAEEDGLVGSQYYVENPLVPIDRTVAYVNFDMLGGRLVPSLDRTSFAVAPETGGALLQQVVRDAVAAEGLDTRSLSYIFGQGRSDYANFVASQVPTVFFSDSEGPCYHSTGDDAHLVDYRKLREQSQIAFRVAVTLAESETPPTFVPPDPMLATFEDAVELHGVFEMSRTDFSRFPREHRVRLNEIAASLQSVVDEGSAAFDAADVATVLGAALEAIASVSELPCPKKRGTRTLPQLPSTLE